MYSDIPSGMDDGLFFSVY